MSALRQMRLFVSVVDTGSFSAASRALGVSVSSVSRQVSTLEEGMGVRLLHRTTRRLGLTEAGSVYYERARQILEDVEEARRAVMRHGASVQGTVRVSAAVAFGQRHIAPLLGEFLAARPHVSVELTLTDRYVDVVEEGVDLAVRVGVLQDSGLIARRLASSRYVLCAAPSYWERVGRPETPEAVSGLNALQYAYRPGEQRWWFRPWGGVGEGVSVGVRGSLRVNNGQVLRDAALEGWGAVMLPEWLAYEELRDGRLERALEQYETTPTRFGSGVHVVYASRRHMPAKTSAFLRFLQERFRPRAPWEIALEDEEEAVAAVD